MMNNKVSMYSKTQQYFHFPILQNCIEGIEPPYSPSSYG